MDRDTVLDLLAIIAAGDHRTIGEPDIVLWQRAIGHLSADDCVEAIEAFRRDQPGVWLEPGHVVQRVRAKVRDRLERADPEERWSMITAAGTKRDSFGAIDKAAKNLDIDPEFPAEWTPEQRTAAYWDRVRAFREGREYEMGRSNSPQLLRHRPAGEEARAQIMAMFADKQFGMDQDPSVPQVAPMSVKCPFCKAKAGMPCTVAGHDEKLRSVPAHPSRFELAAQTAGYSDEVVEQIVASTQRRQARLVQAAWDERDKAPVPVVRNQDTNA